MAKCNECGGNVWECSTCADVVLKSLEAEIARLKKGDFTEEEFQNLCHNFSETDKAAFVLGCQNYQKKLFGDE